MAHLWQAGKAAKPWQKSGSETTIKAAGRALVNRAAGPFMSSATARQLARAYTLEKSFSPCILREVRVKEAERGTSRRSRWSRKRRSETLFYGATILSFRGTSTLLPAQN